MAAAGQIEIEDEAKHEMAFPYPFMRFVPWPEGPNGALPDDVMLSSTSAARNGKFFSVFDVCKAIEESLNLWNEGSPQASCDTHHNLLTSIERFTEPGTIWDLTPPERDPLTSMPRMVACREKVFAFAMGLHPRLGAQVSPPQKIGPVNCRLCACQQPVILHREPLSRELLRKIRLGQDSGRSLLTPSPFRPK